MSDSNNNLIGWVGQRRRHDCRLPTALIEASQIELGSQRAAWDLLVIEAPECGALRDCRALCQRLEEPVLLLVEPEQLGEAADWMPLRHELGSLSDPPQLLRFRLHRMLRPIQPTLDPLTGVWNRGELFAYAGGLLAEAGADSPVSLILLDLDDFKRVNDRHGHAAGDEVLTLVGAVLQRAHDVEVAVGRVGGEEFGVVMRASEEEAAGFSELLRSEIAAHQTGSGVRVTASAGVAAAEGSVEPRQLFAMAEDALYAAKARGRDRSVTAAQLRSESLESGDDLSLIGLENRARVLGERVANDISLRSRKLLETARREAETDGLTQFYTRRHLDRRLAAEFAAHQSADLTIALLDLDHFGAINKTHGWPTGDQVLRETCEVIRRNLRSQDWVGRYGGEEFCLVMPRTSLEQARGVLERLRAAIEAHQFSSTSGQPVVVTASIGAVQRRDRDASAAELLERASTRALEAKRSGRNRVVAMA